MSEQFALDDSIIYLNHAAVAPWPQVTAQAVADFAEQNARTGAANYPEWVKVEADLKQKCQQLINAPSVNDIALIKNTSEGLSFIAHGLPWQKGDNIVTPAHEFPSNRVVWQSLAEHGVELRQVAIDGSDPEQALIDAMDSNTRLLSCSSVQYASGFRLDLAPLGESCQQRDVLFCVDAIQSLGALEFDAQAVQADFVVADGHKWMLGPEGQALFYCRDSLRERLKLHEFGWHMVHNPFDFDQVDWQPAHTAQRFECGSPNMLGTFGLNASLGLLLDHGIAKVEQRVLSKARYTADRLSALPEIELLSPSEPTRQSGIVNFRLKNDQNEALYQQLMDNSVICALRGGGVRLSPHFYTAEAKIDAAIDMIRKFATGR